jgi:hypothetical protein
MSALYICSHPHVHPKDCTASCAIATIVFEIIDPVLPRASCHKHKPSGVFFLQIVACDLFHLFQHTLENDIDIHPVLAISPKYQTYHTQVGSDVCASFPRRQLLLIVWCNLFTYWRCPKEDKEAAAIGAT